MGRRRRLRRRRYRPRPLQHRERRGALSADYYAIVGKFVLSTQEGVIQTYVEFGNSILSVRTVGTTESRHIASWVNPTAGTGNPSDAERVFRIVDSAWQLVVVIGAIAAIPAKFAVEGGRH
jgi:hypothetical protein